ncbi:MAG: 2Fe-2S iron-sulfur cluster-binding protein [Bacillota bacterium]|nr:2Fe-2S iron-sulfur cluster-binding protein [Bacillota bacterium]
MCREVSIEVFRYDPGTDSSPSWRKYEIPFEEKNTVLGALLFIQEKLDPTLAFRYGCRYNRCGLCSLEVNGKPRMSCHSYLEEGMRLGPLSKLPLIRDLVVDRKGLFQDLAKYELFIEKNTDNTVIFEPEQGAKLRGCAECLSCLAACPKYSFGSDDFGGPFLFVKLAQLHFDPRDKKDRIEQAHSLGINLCQDCKKCYCPNGINIYRDAISTLLKVKKND